MPHSGCASHDEMHKCHTVAVLAMIVTVSVVPHIEGVRDELSGHHAGGEQGGQLVAHLVGEDGGGGTRGGCSVHT